jgi:hypothetical protein
MEVRWVDDALPAAGGLVSMPIELSSLMPK